MKKLLITSGWFVSAALTVIVAVTTVHFLTKPQIVSYYDQKPSSPNNQSVLAYTNMIGAIKGITTQVTTEDARPVLIAEFLETHNSPLKPYDYWGQFLTDLADKYNMDYRLLPAIAMQESNLCKKIPAGSFNCLGLGIHTRGTWGFPSFESNFEKAAEILRRNYINQGLITPGQIQDKYTPKSNGSWEFAVNQFMDKLETADF